MAPRYGCRDENKPAEVESHRSVGIAVQINTRSSDPSGFSGGVARFEDVVAELNVAAQFDQDRGQALSRAWDAASMDNSPTGCPTDDPDDWWAYWLAYRALTRENRGNTV